jgi:hypothetical protein
MHDIDASTPPTVDRMFLTRTLRGQIICVWRMGEDPRCHGTDPIADARPKPVPETKQKLKGRRSYR